MLWVGGGAGGGDRAMEKGVRPQAEPGQNYHVFYLSYFIILLTKLKVIF